MSPGVQRENVFGALFSLSRVGYGDPTDFVCARFKKTLTARCQIALGLTGPID